MSLKKMGLVRIFRNRHKVLGLNERYLGFIRPYNLSRGFQIADDKILTKQKLQEADIPVPEMLGHIENHKHLESFDFTQLPKSFVMKPVRGLEGGGIEIFYNRVGDQWIKSDGNRVDIETLKAKFRDILDGKYSLHNQPDSVLLEKRVKPHKAFRYYTYKGTPDIRVIVFNNVPVMGMLRLPTQQSAGKGNLRQGAIGSGIDIAAGRLTQSIIGKSQYIEFVPGTSLRLAGLRIPYWDTILEIAVKASQACHLGYGAVDFLIDRDDGPVIIEVNARAGLSIQLAEQDGLLWRLEKIKGLKVKSIARGVRIGKDLFGGEIEEAVQNLSGKRIVGILEEAKVYGKDTASEVLKVKIDTGADSSSIDRNLAVRLGYGPELNSYDDFIKEYTGQVDLENMTRTEIRKLEKKLTTELQKLNYGIEKVMAVYSSHGRSLRPYIRLELRLAGTKYTTAFSIYDRSKLKYSAIIGRKSLSRFLVDPSKR